MRLASMGGERNESGERHTTAQALSSAPCRHHLISSSHSPTSQIEARRSNS